MPQTLGFGALGCGEMGISGKIVHISLDFDTGGVFLHLLFGKKHQDVVSLAPAAFGPKRQMSKIGLVKQLPMQD